MHPHGLGIGMPSYGATDLTLDPATALPYPRCVAANDFDIHYVADLARLQLSQEEETRLGAQLGNILGYIEQLRTVDVSGVDPTSHAFPLVNVARPDQTRECLAQEDALRNAPLQSNGLFIVPKIVE